MINLKYLITEELNREIPSDEELYEAAASQRGIPESVMLRTVRKLQEAYGSAVLNDALEHIGDLSHRLQEPGGIGMSGAAEKIRKLNRLMFPRAGWMDLEQEIDHGVDNNAAYYIKQKYPNESYEGIRVNHSDELEAKKLSIRKAMEEILPAYVQAHEQHNLPITYAGVLGKQAAIQLGSLNYDELRKTTRELTQFFEANLNSENIYRRA